MSFYPLTIPLANKTTGAPITTYTDLNLRLVETPLVRAYTQLAQSGGNYTFGNVGSPIVSGNYELYDTDTKLTEFGVLPIGEAGFAAGFTMTGNIDMDSNALLNLPVPATDTEPETKGRVAGFVSDLTTLIGTYLLKAGGTMTGAINMGSNNITGLPTPTDVTHPLRQTDGDTRYPRRESGASTQNIASRFFFNTVPPLCNIDATNLIELVSLGQVNRLLSSALSGITSGDITAYQQALNIIRVIPSGADETNKVYTTIAAAKAIAAADADSDRLYFIELHGNGIDGSFTNADYNLLSDGAQSQFIHYRGLNKSVIIRLGDSTYTGGSSSIRTIIADCTVYFDGATSTPVLANIHFSNVKFTGAGTAAVSFNNCKLENGCEYDSTVTPTYNADTVGQIYNLTTERFIFIDPIYDKSNTYQILSTSGDVQPRRLLGRGMTNIASAATITFGNGNAFILTGTTSVNAVTATGWTDGSIIRLLIGGASVTFTTLAGTGSGNLNAATDLVATLGEVVTFLCVSGTFYIYKD